MTSDLCFERGGVRIAGLDFGGDGPPVLLLHGLAGYAGEWAETAEWLTERCRVIALDARGHGRSERFPADVSRAAHIADAAFAVERLRLGPVVVVGQSLGGQTALLLAAQRPDLVRGLVLADAGPGGGEDEQAVEANLEGLRTSLKRWPMPFASRAAAIEFFGGPSLSADAWADGLEHRDGGWWPRFDVEVMVRTLREASSRSYWEEWERVACPVLVVRAGEGSHISTADARAMADRAQLVELGGAGHDLHLDRPAEWRDAVSSFLDSLDAVTNPDPELHVVVERFEDRGVGPGGSDYVGWVYELRVLGTTLWLRQYEDEADRISFLAWDRETPGIRSPIRDGVPYGHAAFVAAARWALARPGVQRLHVLTSDPEYPDESYAPVLPGRLT